MLLMTVGNHEAIVLEIPMPDGSKKEITVWMVEVKSRGVRIGIEAPREIVVLRKELVDKEASWPG